MVAKSKRRQHAKRKVSSEAHRHHQDHKPASYNTAFAAGVALNLGFVVVEVTYGVLADSLALISDAGHNLSDVISLLLAWGANALGRKKASDKRTYGFKRVSILASLISAMLLIFALGIISWEAVGRLRNPMPVQTATLMIVAGIGTVINALTALLFVSGQKHDLNLRAAYLHMIADAGISVGVVISGALIWYTGHNWIDPAFCLLVVGLIFSSTWGLLRESINLAIDAVPKGIVLHEVKHYLQSLPGVCRIHDLHVWAMSTTETALTVHLVVRSPIIDNGFLEQVTSNLHDHFGIAHTTIQVERIIPANSRAINCGCVNRPGPTESCQ